MGVENVRVLTLAIEISDPMQNLCDIRLPTRFELLRLQTVKIIKDIFDFSFTIKII